MAHQIFGERFYAYRKPAWHGLGWVSDTPLTCYAIVSQMAIDFKTYRSVLVAEDDPSEAIRTDNKKAIVRIAPEGKEVVAFVSENFKIVPPLTIAQIWDQVLAWAPETVFFTRNRMVVTAYHEETELLGEDWKFYTIFSFPYFPGESVRLHLSPTRVVCMNTYQSSLLNRAMDARLLHANVDTVSLANWLYGWQTDLETIKNQFAFAVKQMATYPLTTQEWVDLTRDFFNRLLKDRDNTKRIEEFLAIRDYGTQVDTGSVKGWLDAVTEYFDWANLHKDDPLARLFGFRADAKSLAFEFAMAKIS